jgi:hypothetical protein
MFRVFLSCFLFVNFFAGAEVNTIGESIKKLSSDSKNRQLAETYLWQHYPESLKALTVAAKNSKDPQVASSIERILNRIKKGDLPDNLFATTLHYAKKTLPAGKLLEKFKKFSKNGDARAKMWLARIFLKGRCRVKADPVKANKMAGEVIEEIQKLAAGGDMVAQFLLGSAYNEALGVNLDFKKAVKWYSEAAKVNEVLSMNNLAIMLLFGHGTEPNPEQARKYLKKAIDLGSAYSVDLLEKYTHEPRPEEMRQLKTLRENEFSKIIGMKFDMGLAHLIKLNIIKQPKKFEKQILFYDSYKGCNYSFKKDGVFIRVNEYNNRIVSIEALKIGVRFFRQFKSSLPMGLTWDDTRESALKKLGSPESSGSVTGDRAYGMAYRINNAYFSVMFSKRDQRLKIFRIYENWAVKYPDLESN